MSPSQVNLICGGRNQNGGSWGMGGGCIDGEGT